MTRPPGLGIGEKEAAAEMSGAWLEVTFVVSRQQAPLVEAALESGGALSVTLTDAADAPLLEPLPGETPLWALVQVTGLFDDDADSRARVRGLVGGIGGSCAREPVIQRLADRVWERVWLDHFHPMRFGRRLWVVPHGQSPGGGDDAIVVWLDPGLAFGTGTHPTTSLCLRWLDGAPVQGKRVIDYGCGSGILAIAALRLGAAHVLAIDHDPQALEATRCNARRNGVEDRLSVRAPLPTASVDDPPADILLANILSGTLIELAPELRLMTSADGRIILSGVLSEQAAAVSAAYEPWFRMRPPVALDDWTLLEGLRAE